MRALVTGYKGFVGRHLVPKLHAAGYKVFGTEKFSRWLYDGHGFINAAGKGPVVGTTEAWFNDVDVVVHLAANILNVEARMNMGLKAYEDIALDLEVCKFVEKHPPKKAFVMMSSCAVDYPDDPYCWTKRVLEAFAGSLHKKGVETVILRPFSGYGGSQSQEYPFRAILERALRREDPLTVWSGAQVRDWLYIDDLVDAIMWSIDNGPRGMPLEIGTGIGTSLKDLARMIADAVGYQPEIFCDVTKPSSSLYRVAHPENAANLGWFAKTGLREGILTSIEDHAALTNANGIC